MVFRKLTFSFLSLVSGSSLSAQEWNLGLHLNPTLSLTTQTGPNAADQVLQTRSSHLGFNTGLNIRYRNGRWGAETGLNIVRKSVRFYKAGFVGGSPNGIQNYQSAIGGYGFEVPLLATYALYTHQQKRAYQLELVAGGSFEHFQTSSYLGGYWGGYNGGLNVHPKDANTTLQTSGDWANVITGLQLRTALRKMGLFEYGFLYHHPLGSRTYEQQVTATDAGGNPTSAATATNTVRTGYLDLKIAYYFLNVRKSEGRVSYR